MKMVMRFRRVQKLNGTFPPVRKCLMPCLVFGIRPFLGLTKFSLTLMNKQDLCVIIYVRLLTKLYMDTAKLVWNGNPADGKEAILKFFENLPSSEHKIDSLDCHPLIELTGKRPVQVESNISGSGVTYHIEVQSNTANNTDPDQSSDNAPADQVSGGQMTIMVKTYGTVEFSKNKKRSFQQTFMLTSQNNKWMIASDCMRFQE